LRVEDLGYRVEGLGYRVIGLRVYRRVGRERFAGAEVLQRRVAQGCSVERPYVGFDGSAGARLVRGSGSEFRVQV